MYKTSQRFVSLAVATITVAAMTIVSLSGAAVAAPGHGSAVAAPRPGYLPLAGSAAPFTSGNRATGAVAGRTPLTIQVWLRPARPTAAQQYATAVSTPGSNLFHHYLTPDAHTARFGASHAAADAVQSWLGHQGFTGIQADAQRNYVRATATATATASTMALDCPNSSAGRRSRPGSAVTGPDSCAGPTGSTCATTAGDRRSRWSSRV